MPNQFLPIASADDKRGLLCRLRHDERGNTLAIMAAAMFPLAGLVGGGVDMSRLYLAKARLQQACDAGALAGRKVMGAGSWANNGGAANTAANQFFAGNFATGAYGSTGLMRTFTEASGKVSGTASVTVPMTLMKIFGQTTKQLNVVCDAEMRLPNTDVMFVLDTTGSMGSKAVSTDTQTKIQALRSAVKCFYESVAHIDTTETCATGVPPSGASTVAQVRFGFMPYATNVNVGYLLPPEYFANSWTYQSRQAVKDAAGKFSEWRYAPLPVNISPLKNGTAWNRSFNLPIGNTTVGATTITNKVIGWDGCIEERKTIRASTYTSTTGGAAKDLDIDTLPTAGDPESLWGPALHNLIYARNSTASDLSDNDVPGFVLAPGNSTTDYAIIDGNNLDSYYCPTEAKKLQAWPTASPFEAYVDGLTTNGNTYHDIGLIWGARFLSPTGIFRSENAQTPQGGAIERHLIFMTDGETVTGSFNYGPYGLPWFDRRQTDPAVAPTDSFTAPSTGGDLTAQVDARYAAVCQAVKNKNITLWVIWFGAANATLEARLTSCATPNRFYAARNSADLQTTFAAIANQISQLRLTN